MFEETFPLFADDSLIYVRVLNLARKLKVEEVDVDGCLSAEPSDLRGQFKTEWEGHGFFFRGRTKNIFFLFFLLQAPELLWLPQVTKKTFETIQFQARQF